MRFKVNRSWRVSLKFWEVISLYWIGFAIQISSTANLTLDFLKKVSRNRFFFVCSGGHKTFGKGLAPQRATAQIWRFKRSSSGVQLSSYSSALQNITISATGMVISKAHAHLLCMHFWPLDPWTNPLALLVPLTSLLILSSFSTIPLKQGNQFTKIIYSWDFSELRTLDY